MSGTFQIKIYDSISSIDKEQFNRIADETNPFLTYEFLAALELSGSVGPYTTWIPRYFVLTDSGKIIGAVTLYLKLDSYGEFIFDWEWARAYQAAGLSYYPKGVVAIPFTPTTGVRVLIDPDYDYETCFGALIKALIDFTHDERLSSLHFLFVTKREQELLENFGFLTRKTHQYHWNNRSYETFDDFLADLRSGRKKQIRKERRRLSESGLEVELIEKDDIRPEHIDAIWKFYLDTHSRKWGSPYLNREFFELAYENLKQNIVMVLARNGGGWIGGTFNISGPKNLFGRYWGCTESYKFLHFECCFYKLIEYAIDNKIDVFEAGAQGEHKFFRGFAATPTFSSHLILNPAAFEAIYKFVESETHYTNSLIESYNRQSPLKYLYGGGSQ